MDEEASCDASIKLMEEEQYSALKNQSICQLKTKLKQNLTKRMQAIENCINNAVGEIMEERSINIILNPPIFCTSPIMHKALMKMCQVIDNWEGVNIEQCNESKKEFPKYWRTADNWWNRQKGKWYGDLFFYHILNGVSSGSLSLYCQQLCGEKHTTIYWTLYFTFLYKILKTKVQFKKSKPNPVIFDLSLFKSQNLKQWFIEMGKQHGQKWDISKKKSNAQTNTEYAQEWCKKIRDDKYEIYHQHFPQYDNINNINDNMSILPHVQPPPPFQPFQPFQLDNNRRNYTDMFSEISSVTNHSLIATNPVTKPRFYIVQMKDDDGQLSQRELQELYQNPSVRTIYFSQNGSLNPICINPTYINPLYINPIQPHIPYDGTHSSSYYQMGSQSTYYEIPPIPHVQFPNVDNYMTAQCNVIGTK